MYIWQFCLIVAAWCMIVMFTMMCVLSAVIWGAEKLIKRLRR